MSTSILNDIKKALSLDPDYTAFDQDILMHINSVFSTLNQLGVGPVAGFFITDATATWDQLIGEDPRFNAVKNYVYLRVRVLFDPPATAALLTAYKEQIEEQAWRLMVLAESGLPTLPTEFVLDGGGP